MDPNATITTKTGALKIGRQVSFQIQKDKHLNDLDRLYDILLQEKHMLQTYQTASSEMVDFGLYSLMENNRQRVRQCHGRFIDTLFDMGEYTADVAPRSQVKDISEVFMGYLKQLPYEQNIPH